jgi:hypothetical protein
MIIIEMPHNVENIAAATIELTVVRLHSETRTVGNVAVATIVLPVVCHHGCAPEWIVQVVARALRVPIAQSLALPVHKTHISIM